MKLYEEFEEYEGLWDNSTTLVESTCRFYSANDTVQDYIDNVGPVEGGFTLIKNFWLPTNRGKLNVGLISLDSTDGEDGLVCIPSYDTQFVAPMNEAEDVYEMLYNAEAFDDIDAFIDKFIGCSSAESVEKILNEDFKLVEGIQTSTYTVLADVGYSTTKSPKLSLDDAIVSTRTSLLKEGGYVSITWIDEQTGQEVLEYDERLHIIKTDIPKAKTELSKVVKAMQEQDRQSEMLDKLLKLFTQDEIDSMKSELMALKQKIYQINVARFRSL